MALGCGGTSSPRSLAWVWGCDRSCHLSRESCLRNYQIHYQVQIYQVNHLMRTAAKESSSSSVKYLRLLMKTSSDFYFKSLPLT